MIFGKSTRDDLGKLFLGKDAVAYVTSCTPGPGTYELGWQRPFFFLPSREPGTSIGGPLANVDRVQTGPLGPSYRSFTPGPGAYDGVYDDNRIKFKRLDHRRQNIVDSSRALSSGAGTTAPEFETGDLSARMGAHVSLFVFGLASRYKCCEEG